MDLSNQAVGAGSDDQGPSDRLTQLAMRALRTASPMALAHLLRSPARRVVLDAIFWQAARQLGQSRTADLNSTVRCYVAREGSKDADVYELCFKNRSCQMARGPREARPGLTLALDDAELVRLVCGQSTPAQGVFNGRIMVRGDVGQMAATLASAFASRPRPDDPA